MSLANRTLQDEPNTVTIYNRRGSVDQTGLSLNRDAGDLMIARTSLHRSKATRSGVVASNAAAGYNLAHGGDFTKHSTGVG